MKKLLKILIVDDNPQFIKALESTIEEVLGKQQCTIDTAHTGENGLKKIEHKIYDLIFMDINMPGMGGIAAIQQADRYYYRNNSMIIAISFHKELEFVHQVLSAGARHYLVKDEIDIFTLEQILQPYLKKMAME